MLLRIRLLVKQILSSVLCEQSRHPNPCLYLAIFRNAYCVRVCVLLAALSRYHDFFVCFLFYLLVKISENNRVLTQKLNLVEILFVMIE